MKYLLCLFLIGCGASKATDTSTPIGGGSYVKVSVYCITGITALDVSLMYQVVEMSSGDVYVTANVSNKLLQVTDTVFYSVHQAGSVNGNVLIIGDFAGNANGGYFTMQLNRTTLDGAVQYNDTDGSQSQTFSSSNCQAYTF